MPAQHALHGLAVCRQRGRSNAASGGLGGAAGAGESELQLQRRRLATRRKALLAKLGEVSFLGCSCWLYLMVQVQCNHSQQQRSVALPCRHSCSCPGFQHMHYSLLASSGGLPSSWRPLWGP